MEFEHYEINIKEPNKLADWYYASLGIKANLMRMM
jgi:hypothetical protein